jgi:hypothetical protein
MIGRQVGFERTRRITNPPQAESLPHMALRVGHQL